MLPGVSNTLTRAVIGSRQLWATHIGYLNDSQEFRYAKKFISGVFEERIDQSSGEIQRRLVVLQNRYHEHATIWESLNDICVVSFCEDGNLLSQWRAYAANGQGFSLGLKPAMLNSVLEWDPKLRTTCKIVKMIYAAEAQRRYVNFAVDQLLIAMENHGEQLVIERLHLAFSDMTLCFKHGAFEEEKEWRLVCGPHPERLPEVRVTNGKLIPYIVIPTSREHEPPPYSEVIHGPTLDGVATIRSVQILLCHAHRDFWDDIGVSGSDVPLRS
jgi:Protein of unknown function (DUF2971)